MWMQSCSRYDYVCLPEFLSYKLYKVNQRACQCNKLCKPMSLSLCAAPRLCTEAHRISAFWLKHAVTLDTSVLS